jgi:transketolase
MSAPTTSSSTEKATRDSFGEAIKALGMEMPNLVVLDADLSVSTKSVTFAKAFPERFYQMGISEANMIGVAAGLSFTGLVPFCCSFGCFIAGRYETIRVSVGYSNANVKIVGTHAGLGIGDDGYTQMGLEDIAVLRPLPGMTIIQPSDDVTARAAVRWAAHHVGPVYLRLTRQKLPILHKDPSVFQMGRAIILKEGKDLALIGTGATVSEALKAADELSSRNPWVIDMHTIKPLDRALMKRLAHSCKQIVTIEDHQITGGLGSAVAEALTEEGFSGKLLRLGAKDCYGESGDPGALYEKYGLSGKRIAARVAELT